MKSPREDKELVIKSSEEFPRFNEDLEQIVTYRIKDPMRHYKENILLGQHKKQHSEERNIQAFNEVKEMMERSAPGGSNPV